MLWLKTLWRDLSTFRFVDVPPPEARQAPEDGWERASRLYVPVWIDGRPRWEVYRRKLPTGGYEYRAETPNERQARRDDEFGMGAW
jgi:hypothetical protein